jgi:nucleoside-diphosphate-sugar epimerase
VVGAPLVGALVDAGHEVIALARSDAGARALRDRGASVIRGDLRSPAAWGATVRDAELVFHAGLPRMVPPVRARHLRRLARDARVAALAVGHAVEPGAVVVLAGCALGDARGLLAIAGPARAAEQALAGTSLRVVRLPWVYGRSGFINDLARGLAMRRFRVVGPGHNHLAVISARDAAAALIAASGAAPGTYAVAEPEPPTQVELVHHICREAGVPRPDHLPPRMASISMGGPVVDALLADHHVEGAPLPAFSPSRTWRNDLMAALAGD